MEVISENADPQQAVTYALQFFQSSLPLTLHLNSAIFEAFFCLLYQPFAMTRYVAIGVRKGCRHWI